MFTTVQAKPYAWRYKQILSHCKIVLKSTTRHDRKQQFMFFLLRHHFWSVKNDPSKILSLDCRVYMCFWKTQGLKISNVVAHNTLCSYGNQIEKPAVKQKVESLWKSFSFLETCKIMEQDILCNTWNYYFPHKRWLIKDGFSKDFLNALNVKACWILNKLLSFQSFSVRCKLTFFLFKNLLLASATIHSCWKYPFMNNSHIILAEKVFVEDAAQMSICLHCFLVTIFEVMN